MSESITNNKRIAKNTLFLYIRMGLVLVVSLYTTRVIINALGIEDYGIFNVVSGFVSMFSFLNTSMSNGVQRFYNYSIGSQDEYSIADVYNTAIQIQGLLSVIILILLETFGMWYINTQMVIPMERLSAAIWVFQFSVGSLLLLVMQIPYSAAIMAYERMDYFAYLSVFEACAKLCIAFSIKYTLFDRLILLGALNFFVSLICFALYYGYAKKNFCELKVDFKIRKQLFRPMVSFSGWNVLGSFAYMIKGQGLNMLLNQFFGPVINAARGISTMMLNAIQGFQSNIVIAFRPQIVQSYAAGNKERVLKLFYSLSKVSFVLLSMLSIPVILEIDYILHIWLGDQVPEYTVQFSILVLINMVISSLNTPISQIIHATGKMKNYQIGTSIIICAILPISWIFLKKGFNPMSVYWTSLVITIINQVVCNLLLKRVFRYSLTEYCKKVVSPCALFALVVPILPYMLTISMPQSFIRFILTVCLSTIVALIILFSFVLDKMEKNLILSFIKRNK